MTSLTKNYPTELKNKFPLLTKEEWCNNTYRIVQIDQYYDYIEQTANHIDSRNSEIEYLLEFSKFVTFINNHYISKIENRLKNIELSNKFKIEEIEKLPTDIINHIKGYLEPEIIYTRKFSIIYNLTPKKITAIGIPYDFHDYFEKVPKKIILRLLDSSYITICRLSKDQKYFWTKEIEKEVEKLFSENKSSTSVSNLLTIHNSQYGIHKQIDKWYKFFLYVEVFKRYRKRLEDNEKKNKTSLIKLKNTYIKTKK